MCGLSCVSLLLVLICWVVHRPKCRIGRALMAWLCDRLHEEVVPDGEEFDAL